MACCASDLDQLAFHTIGLAFLVGISSATTMRILGVARAVLVVAVIALLVGYVVGRSLGWIGAASAQSADAPASE